MSELNLGRIRMVPKGAWSASDAYKMLDIVTSNGSSYVCIADAVAGTLLSDTTHWQLVAEKGAKGDKGDTGAKGDPGTKGDTGASGTAATIAVGTVSSGANAAVTNSGTDAAAKFNFVLPKGDKGDRGVQGASITNAAMNADGELIITIGA